MMRDERGSSLVELSLGLLMLLGLVAVIVDLGIVFRDYIIICNASREGARYGSLNSWSASGIMQAAIQEAADSGLTLTPGDIGIDGLSAVGGDPIRVTVTHHVALILGGLTGWGDLTIQSSTEMVVLASAP